MLANAQTGSITGVILDQDNKSVEMAQVAIKGSSKGVTSDKNGKFLLSGIAPGKYTLAVIFLGYATEEKTVTVRAGETTSVNFTIKEIQKELQEVAIVENSKAQEVKESGFQVNTIEMKQYQNIATDVNTVLNRTTGVRIRQQGGLGSDFSFSLNGFTGNQVRFFIDGLPTDYLGSSLTFNNIPVNVVERIEVYKGVVPVSLGADALGGAVNVVTSNNAKDFLDVSYSYGSFNTHQAAVVNRSTFKRGFVINTSGFFNYSDNTYRIDASTIDKNTGKINEPKPYRRFNDAYRSNTIMLETGFVNKPWADRLLIGVIATGNRKEIQQGANMTKVAGEVFRTDKALIPTLKYQKSNLFTENLSLKVSSIYAYNQSMTIDTSSKTYDWDGSYTIKAIDSYSGELNWGKTQFRFNDHAALTTATLEYQAGKRHTITLNNTYSWFQRQGEDPLRLSLIPFSSPNILSKNVTGLSYTISLWKKRLSATVFAKLFNMDAHVYHINDFDEGIHEQETNILNQGQGIAIAVFALKNLQVKLSYENTYRMPESYELFGDGLLLISNPTLTPEKSRNINAGVLYSKKTGNNTITAEAGFIYRKPENMIRLVAIGILSQYENLSSAGVTGYEAAIRYAYKKWLSIEANATYQDIRNTNKAVNNFPDPLYLDRLPNIPYLFGNAMLGLQSNEMGKYKLKLGFDWSTLYVEKFYLNWPSQGNTSDKFVIPRQLSHDASLTLSSHEGRYNLTFSCFNLLDTRRYDNFKVQKPGRSFNVKLRFYLSKFKKQ